MSKINSPKLSGNALKIIGAVTMFIDHTGVLFFPEIILFRVIGRLSFPIFAYLIAEGCRHTKNLLKYFLNLSIFGGLFQFVYFFFTGSCHMNIFITYAISLPMIYALQHLKSSLKDKRYLHVASASFYLAASTVFAYIFHSTFSVDYGFAGSLVPFASSICMSRDATLCESTRRREHLMSVFFCGISLVCLAYPFKDVQIFGLTALPMLAAYSGERGKSNLKNFFYVFYPAHLVILYGLKELINHLN